MVCILTMFNLSSMLVCKVTGDYKCWNGLEWNGLLEWLARFKFPVVLIILSQIE